MRRITVALETLEIVTLLQGFDHKGLPFGKTEPLKLGEERHLFLWPHVGENHSSDLRARIALVMNLVLQSAVRRFSRSLKNIPLNIIFPTMINASEPAFLVPPVKQRGAPVGAVLI